MDDARRARIDRFILDEIETVPHLEALLLLFSRRPSCCTAEEMAGLLYVQTEVASRILEGLRMRQLVATSGEAPIRYQYAVSSQDRDQLIEDVEALYRRELVRIASMIHSKASPGVLDFARAFRFKKDKP